MKKQDNIQHDISPAGSDAGKARKTAESALAAQGTLAVTGARVHNLKNIDVEIPHGTLSVITGVSGSGKSSLAFDTIYAEGQRRYIETFSSYARGMLGALERPDVDKISGLAPVIAIEQKTINRNPRSTIGTTTEVYDYLRLLYARAGVARSYISGEEMVKYTPEKIVGLIVERYDGKAVYLLAPLVNNRKGHYKDLFEQLTKKGFLNVRVDGEMREITPGMKLDRYRNHSIELVIDKLKVSRADVHRLSESVAKALAQGQRQMMVLDRDSGEARHYSQELMDPVSGISYREPAPHNFSFNSPLGACPCCKGLGEVSIVDRDKIIPDPRKSIYDGGIVPLGKYRNSMIFWQISAICEKHGVTLKTPVKDLPEEAIDDILNGTSEPLRISSESQSISSYMTSFEGLVKYLEIQLADDDDVPASARKWSGQFFSRQVCPECRGARLNKQALHFFVDGKNIAELSALDISDLYEWSKTVEERLTDRQRRIATEIIKEIRSRLAFLEGVGLGYLSLARPSATLSGGESQRIRLASQLGSDLVNVLYVLDEPSIGLHPSDNRRLIDSLKSLRDAGNSVIVVEHDRDIMLDADYIVDIGPGAGRAGGSLLFEGTPARLLESKGLTADYLSGRRHVIPTVDKKRPAPEKWMELLGATGHNLQDVDFRFPLGTLTCVCGVSGSGKSSLVNGTLRPILTRHFYRSLEEPLPYRELRGLEHIDKVITVDQSPLGRSPRSNPATYTGVFSDIRALYVSLPESKIRAYKPGRFSFNVAGGRCEECKGNGWKAVEMNFLPDVLVPCEACGGKRYNRETLEVRFKGKSIADVLDMTVDQAVEFFANQPKILRKVKALADVGLGYIKLGQPSSTLSGGENQRVKLATELARPSSRHALYILDEPTTGLHFADVATLLGLLRRLVDRGNTVLVIEHNTDVINAADYIVDMGPGGGRMGGRIVAAGTPAEIAATSSPTAPFIETAQGA